MKFSLWIRVLRDTTIRHFVPLVIIIAVGFFGMRALLTDQFFTAHDIWHQVARLYWYNESVSNGIVPPTWIAPLANGFGYPLFIFSYHAPWILGVFFLKLGFSIPATINGLFVFSYVVSGIGMYWVGFLFSKRRFIGVVAAVLYLLAPWRFVTILVSAAMGRSFIMLLLPFLVVGLYYLSRQKQKWWGVLLFALTLSAIILSHLISAMTALLIIIPCIWYFKPERKMLFATLILTIALTAWYVIPIIQLSKLIQVSKEPFNTLYQNQFVSVGQLLYSKWGYGIVNATAKEGAFSYQLGFAQWSVLFIATVLSLRKKITLTRDRSFVILVLIFSFLSLFLTTEHAKPLWDSLHSITTFDYPTMFLMPALFLPTLLVIFVLMHIRFSRVLGVVLILIALFNTRNYMRVNQYFDRSVKEIVESETTTNSFHEYLPKTADVHLLSTAVIDVEGEDIENLVVTRSINTTSYRMYKGSDGNVILKVFYFPGLLVRVNNSLVTPSVVTDGRVMVHLSKGVHEIVITYH